MNNLKKKVSQNHYKRDNLDYIKKNGGKVKKIITSQVPRNLLNTSEFFP